MVTIAFPWLFIDRLQGTFRICICCFILHLTARPTGGGWLCGNVAPTHRDLCFADHSALPFLLCASFGLIIFLCPYTHLNHFTVILLMANFKLLPHGRQKENHHPPLPPALRFSLRLFTFSRLIFFFSFFMTAITPQRIIPAFFCSAYFALFFEDGHKSIRLIYYLFNFWPPLVDQKLSLYKLTICYVSPPSFSIIYLWFG